MPPDALRPPDALPLAAGSEEARQEALLRAQAEQVRLAGGINRPSMFPFLQNGMRQLHDIWGRDVHLRITNMGLLKTARDTQGRVSRSRADEAIKLDLGSRLNRIIGQTDRTAQAINPTQLLIMVEDTNKYIAETSQIGILNSESRAALADVSALMSQYIAAIGRAPGHLNQPLDLRPIAPRGAENLPPWFGHMGQSRELANQQMDIVRLGVAVVALPVFAFIVTTALFTKKKERSFKGAAFWGLAALIAIMGHKFFESRTDRWVQEVGFLGEARYDYFRTQYGMDNETTAPHWATFYRKINDGTGVSSDALRLSREQRTLNAAEKLIVLNAFTPEGSPIRASIRQMLASTAPGKEEGHEFHELVAMFRQPRTTEGRRFAENFLRIGASPARLAELPVGPPRPPPAP